MRRQGGVRVYPGVPFAFHRPVYLHIVGRGGAAALVAWGRPTAGLAWLSSSWFGFPVVFWLLHQKALRISIEMKNREIVCHLLYLSILRELETLCRSDERCAFWMSTLRSGWSRVLGQAMVVPVKMRQTAPQHFGRFLQ